MISMCTTGPLDIMGVHYYPIYEDMKNPRLNLVSVTSYLYPNRRSLGTVRSCEAEAQKGAPTLSELHKNV